MMVKIRIFGYAGKRRQSHGLSIVELMVGITIGLFILAGTTLMLTSQLSDNRKLLLEAQIQQDLRATADMISRDIRRAGYWAMAYCAVWPDNATKLPSQCWAGAAPRPNPYAVMALRDVAVGSTQVVYARSTDEEGGIRLLGHDDNLVDGEAGRPREQVGFQFNTANKTIDFQVGAGNWQALTDPTVLEITRFDLVLNNRDLPVPCGAQCPALGVGGCPLWQTTRDVTITIIGRAVHDPNILRSLSDSVRLRNDRIREVCPP